MNNHVKKYKAVTLVELLIVLGILGIVMAVGSSILVFGTRAMRLSEAKATNQFDVRVPMGQIEDLIRYAGQLEIIDTEPIAGSLDNYVILDSLSDNKIVHFENGIEKQIPGLDNSGGYDLKLSLKSGTTDTVVLSLSKTGVAGFELLTEVVALNLDENGVDGLSEGIGFIYGDIIVAPDDESDDEDEDEDSDMGQPVIVTVIHDDSDKETLVLEFDQTIYNVAMTSADSVVSLGLNRYRFYNNKKFPNNSSLKITFENGAAESQEIHVRLNGQSWGIN